MSRTWSIGPPPQSRLTELIARAGPLPEPPGPLIERNDGKSYFSCTVAARELGVGRTALVEAVKRQGYCRGYRWKKYGEAWKVQTRKPRGLARTAI